MASEAWPSASTRKGGDRRQAFEFRAGPPRAGSVLFDAVVQWPTLPVPSSGANQLQMQNSSIPCARPVWCPRAAPACHGLDGPCVRCIGATAARSNRSSIDIGEPHGTTPQRHPHYLRLAAARRVHRRALLSRVERPVRGTLRGALPAAKGPAPHAALNYWVAESAHGLYSSTRGGQASENGSPERVRFGL